MLPRDETGLATLPRDEAETTLAAPGGLSTDAPPDDDTDAAEATEEALATEDARPGAAAGAEVADAGRSSSRVMRLTGSPASVVWRPRMPPRATPVVAAVAPAIFQEVGMGIGSAPVRGDDTTIAPWPWPSMRPT
jgi:hypothetical protein